MKSVRVLALMGWMAAVVLPGAVLADESDDNVLEWSWKTEAVQGGSGNEVDVVLTAHIKQGWILYSSNFEPPEFGPRPAKIAVLGAKGIDAVGTPRAIGAHKATDKNFGGEYSYTYFSGDALFKQRVRYEPGATAVSGTINGQTCFKETGLCALFKKDFTVALR